MTFIVYPEEFQRPNKTREYDQSIPLDFARQQCLVPAVLDLQSRRRGCSKLWPLTCREYYERFGEALWHLQLWASQSAGCFALERATAAAR